MPPRTHPSTSAPPLCPRPQFPHLQNADSTEFKGLAAYSMLSKCCFFGALTFSSTTPCKPGASSWGSGRRIQSVGAAPRPPAPRECSVVALLFALLPLPWSFSASGSMSQACRGPCLVPGTWHLPPWEGSASSHWISPSQRVRLCIFNHSTLSLMAMFSRNSIYKHIKAKHLAEAEEMPSGPSHSPSPLPPSMAPHTSQDSKLKIHRT